MITTSGRRRTPILTIALLISLVLHLTLALVYGGLASRRIVARVEPPADDLAALSDVIRIEQRAVPRQAVVRPVTPAPRVAPRLVARGPAATPEPTPAPVARPSAGPAVRPTPAPAPARELTRIERSAAPQPRVVAAAEPATTASPAAAAAAAPALTPEQIAALTTRFAQTIAQTQSDVVNHPVPDEPPAAARRDKLIMSGEQHVLQHAQGYYDVLESWRSGDVDWYYLSVRMQWPDGYAESTAVPWPLGFPSADDPVARHDRLTDVPPPPGYVLPHPFQLSRIVCTYFRAQCQAVLDAEDRGDTATVSK